PCALSCRLAHDAFGLGQRVCSGTARIAHALPGPRRLICLRRLSVDGNFPGRSALVPTRWHDNGQRWVRATHNRAPTAIAQSEMPNPAASDQPDTRCLRANEPRSVTLRVSTPARVVMRQHEGVELGTVT